MSDVQRRILEALGHRALTAGELAGAIDVKPRHCQRALDALYRRSLATITPLGKWCATERGRRAAGAPAS